MKILRETKNSDSVPIPPLSLIYKVSSSANIEWFLRSGKLAVQSIERVLNKTGHALKDFSTIFDFGCGCGRVIRHLKK